MVKSYPSFVNAIRTLTIDGSRKIRWEYVRGTVGLAIAAMLTCFLCMRDNIPDPEALNKLITIILIYSR